MQGSFEKKVQEKLDELKLTPSAPVWEKIELEIQPAKKRRRAFFWIPFVVVLLAGGTFYISSVNNRTPVNEHSADAKKAPTIVERSPDEKAAFDVEKTDTEKAKETFTSDIIPTKKVKTTVTNKEKNDKFLSVSASDPLNINTNRRLAVPGNIASDRKPKRENTKPANAEQAGVPITADRETVAERNNAEMQNKLPVPENLDGENKLPSADSVVKEEKKAAPPVNDTANVKRKIARLQPKWRKTIELQGGWNRPATGLFSTASADLYASPSTGANNPPQPGYNTGGYGPGRVSGGRSFAIGAGFTRTISPHFDVSVGLRYSFHRLYTRVGSFQRIDTSFALSNRSTAVQGYYRNGSSSTYNINHHLLELPVSISYKPIAKLPVSVDVGVSYGRLLSSNLLTYNIIGNAFYYNSDNIPRNHFSAFSSLQFSLINRPAIQLKIGPVVQYQFTSMQKQTFGKPVQLSFAGIRNSISF